MTARPAPASAIAKVPAPVAAGLTLSGVVTVNGRPQDRARVRQAYVQQQDLFYSQLTVRCGAARRARGGKPPGVALRHG